jgi:hypothetical protein
MHGLILQAAAGSLSVGIEATAMIQKIAPAFPNSGQEN